MLLELADHDGDLDRAIELLASGTPRDGAIVRRLWQAGRDADALVWLDQAAEAGRLSARGGANDYWLEPLEVATAYHEAGRVDDALGVLRGAFARHPGAGTFRQPVDFVAAVERGDDMRQWALATARQQAAATPPSPAGSRWFETSRPAAAARTSSPTTSRPSATPTAAVRRS